MTGNLRDVGSSGPRRGSSGVVVSVLGSVGSRVDEEAARPCSGYVVSDAASAVLLDCGPGTYLAWRDLVPKVALDALVLTHAHHDHVGDLAQFLGDAFAWRSRPRVVASPATWGVLVLDAATADGLERVDGGDQRPVAVGATLLTFSTTTHQVPTLAVQVAMSGRRVVYTSDTGPTWSAPVDFVGADLAVVECTLEARRPGDSAYHLDAREAARVAQRLDAACTLLAHVPPGADASARVTRARSHAPELTWRIADPGLRVALD